MLSPASKAIVTATAGVVAENAVKITSCFYPKMFAAHPELLNVFNRADQALGEQPQALAASVVAYAVHLIDPGAPSFEPVLARIAHKHVSLGITPAQYTIVGHYLMEAIGEVLGDAVTKDVAMAWDEVYWLFALQLVAQEAKLYALQEVDPDQPWRDYEVTERFDEVADEIVTFTMRPSDGGTVPPHRPGQYVSVNARLADGSTQPRQYTISAGPRDESLQFTVRRVRAAQGAPAGVVSNWLHDECPVGSTLQLSVPCGDVVLDDTDEPLVLISAGVGITPMAAILDDLAQRRPSRPVILAHADKDAASHAMYRATSASAKRLDKAVSHLWYEEVGEENDHTRGARQGYMDLSDLQVPEKAHVFMCGPLPFMRDARATLIRKGVAPKNIRYEVFGPDLWAQNPDAA